MPGRALIIVLAVAAVAIAFVTTREGDERSDARAPAQAPAGAARVSFLYSPEKDEAARAAGRAVQRVAGARRRQARRSSTHGW